MASYRKRGSRWEVSLCVNGARESTTKPTKAEAQAWAREREAALLRPKHLANNNTVIEMIDRYMLDVSAQKRGHRWEALRANRFKDAAFAKKRVGEVTPADIASWRDQRLSAVAGATVQREMILWSHMFSVAIKEWGWLQVNPLAQVRKPRSAPPRCRVYHDDEVVRLLVQLRVIRPGLDSRIELPVIPALAAKFPGSIVVLPHDPHHLERTQEVGVLFLLALETAMRQGELLALRVSDLDLVRRVVQIRQSKTGRPREVPLSPLAAAVFEYLLGQPCGRMHDAPRVKKIARRIEDFLFVVRSASRDVLFRRALTSAQVEHATFHDARHTAITRLAQVLSPLELARVVGHSDLKMLLVYYNESAENLAKKL